MGFPPSSAPRSYPRRTSGWGQVSDTDPDYIPDIVEPPSNAVTHGVRPHVAPEATARCQLGRCSWSAASAGAGQCLGGFVDGGEAGFDVALHRPQALVPGFGHDDVRGDIGFAEVGG